MREYRFFLMIFDIAASSWFVELFFSFRIAIPQYPNSGTRLWGETRLFLCSLSSPIRIHAPSFSIQAKTRPIGGTSLLGAFLALTCRNAART
jgi:hypothetical protein